MPRGGARPRSGPAQDPNALRRDTHLDKYGWTLLPAEGRQGDAPPWPLVTPSAREAEMWATFWSKPQAVIWERDHLVEVVALFVRQFCEGEIPKTSAENRKTIKAYLGDLYLTSDSMAKAHIRIAGDEAAAPERSEAAPRKSSRSRLTVVQGDAA